MLGGSGEEVEGKVSQDLTDVGFLGLKKRIALILDYIDWI